MKSPRVPLFTDKNIFGSWFLLGLNYSSTFFFFSFFHWIPGLKKKTPARNVTTDRFPGPRRSTAGPPGCCTPPWRCSRTWSRRRRWPSPGSPRCLRGRIKVTIYINSSIRPNIAGWIIASADASPDELSGPLLIMELITSVPLHHPNQSLLLGHLYPST